MSTTNGTTPAPRRATSELEEPGRRPRVITMHRFFPDTAEVFLCGQRRTPRTLPGVICEAEQARGAAVLRTCQPCEDLLDLADLLAGDDVDDLIDALRDLDNRGGGGR